MNINIAAIVFDHTRGLAPGSTVPLRYDALHPVLVPEWQRGQRFPSVAAYAIDQLTAQATVLVHFIASPDVPRQVEVRALVEPLPTDFPSPALLLGDLAPQVISFDVLGWSAWQPFSFRTEMLAAGIDCATLLWRWQARADSRSPWIDIDVTQHRVYALLGLPGDPWRVSPPNLQNTELPRTDMLDFACLWARGARSQAEVAARITQAVNRLGGSTLFYDAQVGAPHYTVLGVPRFLCDAFLDRMRGGFGSGPLVNCSDCATIVSTFTNLLGCDLWQSKMGLVGPGFRLNPILAIGSLDWSTLHGGFGFHEVAWTAACREDDLVYDACVRLDADATPGSAPHVPLLPLGMRFGRPGEGGYRDRIALRADQDECVPQPTLRIRRSVAGVTRPVPPMPQAAIRAVAERTGISKVVRTKDDWCFERFCWFGNELGPYWLPAASMVFEVAQPSLGGSAESTRTLPIQARTIVSTWRPLRQPHALLRIEVQECDSQENAQRSMLQLAAEIADPKLHSWVPEVEGHVGLALDNGALVLFTRGNLILVLRSAGMQTIDVRELAQKVDQWLIGAGSVNPSSPPGFVPSPVDGPMWLRWHSGTTRKQMHTADEHSATTRSQVTVVTPAHATAWVTRLM